jgi:hypothetical protein
MEDPWGPYVREAAYRFQILELWVRAVMQQESGGRLYDANDNEDEPISTAVTESTVQRLLHRRMNAQQHMRWLPRGAHLMLKVRTATANGTLERDYAVAERWARRPFRRAA